MGFGAGASRAERKAKRRKIENSIPDVPDDIETEANDDGAVSTKRKRSIDDDANVGRTIASDQSEEITNKNVESHHKSKKNKTSSAESSSLPMQLGEPSDIAETDAAPKKSKKERKAERKAREADAKSTSTAQTAEPPTGNAPGTNATGPSDQITAEKKRTKTKKQGGVSGDNSESKAARFIVFIGRRLFLKHFYFYGLTCC